MDATDIDDARKQLEACSRLVERLQKMCCEPDRSPRMAAILVDLATARTSLPAIDSTDAAAKVIAQLEDIGGRIGHLQVACCTDARMPLYADTLSGLAATQIHVSTSIGNGQ